ncbi:hypothetical protein Tco_0278263 [Tanacetum coccineum]
MVRLQFWQIRAHSDPILNIDVLYDYVDSVDSDMFSLYELFGMLKELGLGDNNQILFTHFRIYGMSLDDGFVLLMTNVDWKRLKVGHDIVAWYGKEEVVSRIIEPTNDEYVGYSYFDNETSCDIHDKLQHIGDIHEKVQETLMDDDLFQQDSVVDCQQDPNHVINEEQDCNNDLAQDIDEEVIEKEENVDEEEEGLVEDKEDNYFEREANKLPYSEPEADIQHFHFKVDANLDQSRMFADKL